MQSPFGRVNTYSTKAATAQSIFGASLLQGSSSSIRNSLLYRYVSYFLSLHKAVV